MTISLIGIGALSASNTNGATITYNWPSGYSPVPGDMAILIHGGWKADPSTQADVDTQLTNATPSGYSYYAGYWRATGTNLRLTIGFSFRFLTGGESAPQATVPAAFSSASSANQVLLGYLVIYRGVHNVNHFYNADYIPFNSGAANTVQVSGGTTSLNNMMALEAVIQGDANTIIAGSMYGWTFHAGGSSYTTTLGANGASAFADYWKASAGSISAAPCVFNGQASDSWVGILATLESASITSAPGTPSVTPNAVGGFGLSWSAPASDGGAIVIKYIIEHSTDNSNWSYATETTGTSVNVSGYGNNALRYFRIVAQNGVGYSYGSSASGTTWTFPSQPGAPGVTPNGAGSFSISWSAPSNGGTAITGYTVEVSTDNSNWSTAATPSASPVTVSGYGPNATRYFRVIATNAVGNSTPSASTVGTTWNLPGTVTDLSAINNLNNTFTLNWTPPSNGGTVITDYLVEWSLAGAGSWTAWSHSALGAVNTCLVTGLVAANSYDFRIKAINAAGTASTYSNIASVSGITKGYWGVALNA